MLAAFPTIVTLEKICMLLISCFVCSNSIFSSYLECFLCSASTDLCALFRLLNMLYFDSFLCFGWYIPLWIHTPPEHNTQIVVYNSIFVINLVILIRCLTGMFLNWYVLGFLYNVIWAGVAQSIYQVTGIEILHLPRLGLEPTQPHLKWVLGLFPASKVVGVCL